MEKFNSYFDILGKGTQETQLKLNLFINYPKLNRAVKTALSISIKSTYRSINIVFLA